MKKMYLTLMMGLLAVSGQLMAEPDTGPVDGLVFKPENCKPVANTEYSICENSYREKWAVIPSAKCEESIIGESSSCPRGMFTVVDARELDSPYWLTTLWFAKQGIVVGTADIGCRPVNPVVSNDWRPTAEEPEQGDMLCDNTGKAQDKDGKPILTFKKIIVRKDGTIALPKN